MAPCKICAQAFIRSEDDPWTICPDCRAQSVSERYTAYSAPRLFEPAPEQLAGQLAGQLGLGESPPQAI